MATRSWLSWEDVWVWQMHDAGMPVSEIARATEMREEAVRAAILRVWRADASEEARREAA